MAGPRTLKVVEALCAAGLEAWTPTQVATRRRPRSKAKIDVKVPIAPTFAFVRAEHRDRLRAAMALPVSPFPPFSFFEYAGGIPLIADAEIAGLRAKEAASTEEWKAELKRRAVDTARDERDRQRREIRPGTAVGAKTDCMMGLTGVVISGKRKEAMVEFGNGFRMKIDTWLLVEDEVRMGSAA